MRKHWKWAAVVAACTLVSARAGAQVAACDRTITRENLAACARARSFAVRVAQEDVRAAEGRRASAAPLLPSNPVLAGNAARREGGEDGPAVVNWQASVAQEIEIAGQRGARVRAAEDGIARDRERLRAAQRDAVAAAWRAYFAALAAREDEALAREVAGTARAFTTAAAARAEKGVGSPLDADLARAAAIRLELARIEASRAVLTARADLAGALGVEPAAPLEVEGPLEPIAAPGDTEPPVGPEVRAAEADARFNDTRAEALRRERVPNPTVSMFGGREELNRTYYGVGLSFPLPLPGAVGRTHAGEIAEAEALSARARVEAERERSAAAREVRSARIALDARREAIALFRSEDVARARAALIAIADEVGAGRMPVRDAVLAQQALLELLRGYAGARRDLCLASVELARVAGALTEGGSR